MKDQEWLAADRERVQASLNGLDSLAFAVANRAQLLARALTSLATSVEGAATAVDSRRNDDVDFSRVLRLAESHQFHSLTPRERRALAGQPGRVSGGTMAALLRMHPTLVRHFVRGAISDWESFRDSPQAADVPTLLGDLGNYEWSSSEEQPVSITSLLRRDGPRFIAGKLKSVGLVAALSEVRTDFRLRSSWTYTGFVLVEWLQLCVARRLHLAEIVRELLADEAVNRILMPASAAGVQLATAQNAPVRTTVGIQAFTVATVLGAAQRLGPSLDIAVYALFLEATLRSTFGDPRLEPVSEGWRTVHSLNPVAYELFLSSLIEQDLEVFFEHAMNEPDRRKFWLRYMQSIRRTACVLAPAKRRELQRELSGSPELAAAISRSFRFKMAGNVQAFCLTLGGVTVVEFSDDGNAAYVYIQSNFEEDFLQNLVAGKLSTARELKDQRIAVHRIFHHYGWEEKTEAWLASRGILPDP